MAWISRGLPTHTTEFPMSIIDLMNLQTLPELEDDADDAELQAWLDAVASLDGESDR